MRISLFFLVVSLGVASFGMSQQQPTPASNLAIWPDLAPDETSRATGNALAPPRKPSKPPITRIENIRKPTLDVFPAENPSGVGILILPGGGFNYVVPDLEGSEAVPMLNKLGISVFVLRYRTKQDKNDSGWKHALQDAQRAMKLLRVNSKKWNLDKDKIGLLGFSAGGQVAARLLTDNGNLSYVEIDEVDKISHRPDFSILIYPWNMYAAKTDSLLPELKPGQEIFKTVPPTFIVHTNDDRSSSLGSVLFYAELRKASVDAELHVYRNGGHGYGTRTRPDSNIGTWPDRLVEWLTNCKLAIVADDGSAVPTLHNRH